MGDSHTCVYSRPLRDILPPHRRTHTHTHIHTFTHLHPYKHHLQGLEMNEIFFNLFWSEPRFECDPSKSRNFIPLILVLASLAPQRIVKASSIHFVLFYMTRFVVVPRFTSVPTIDGLGFRNSSRIMSGF